MVAADPDDGDAVIGYGDTLTLTFDAPTAARACDQSPLSSSWIDSMLVGPPAPANAWSGLDGQRHTCADVLERVVRCESDAAVGRDDDLR